MADAKTAGEADEGGTQGDVVGSEAGGVEDGELAWRAAPAPAAEEDFAEGGVNVPGAVLPAADGDV